MPLPRHLGSYALALPLLLAACGGGGDGGGSNPPPLSCSVADQNTSLRSYFSSNYYWYALAPNPSPAGFSSLDLYFDALLYGGGDLIPGSTARWPKDRYSFHQTTSSFNQFFGDGQTLGYGLSVAGGNDEALMI